jgi:hypothetical protein
MPSWPETLPQYVLVQGYGEQPPETAVWSRMEAGPDASRRRFTAGETPVTAAIAVTAAQKTILESFFKDDLKGGALAFDWVHPVTRAAASMRLRRVAFQAESGNSFVASLELRLLP